MTPPLLESLVRACQAGEAPAQAAFYSHYKKRLLGVCRRYARTTFEAEDIFQEAFIKVFRKIGELRQPETVNFWIKSLVIRTAIDHFRKNRPFWLTEDAGEAGVLPESEDDFDVLDFLENGEILAAINALPDGFRTVVNLYLIDGYEHHEIAGLLGISEGTSKSQLSRAKAQLRKNFQAIGLKNYEKG